MGMCEKHGQYSVFCRDCGMETIAANEQPPMEYSDACTKLADLIQGGHYQYPEEAGLAIQIFNRAINAEEYPAMALALAENLSIET